MPLRHTRHIILLATGMLLLAIAAGTALLLDHTYRTARATAQGVVQRAASVVESTVNRLFLQVDGTLASLPELLRKLEQDGRTDANTVSGTLRSLSFQNLNFRDLVLARSDGIGWATAQPASRGRALPADLPAIDAALRSGAVTIAGPARNPTTGEWALFFARPIQLPHADTMLAVAEVPIPLMVTLLAPAAEARGLRVAVRRASGQLLVGLPHDEGRIGRQVDIATASNEQIIAARPTLYRSISVTVSLDAEAGLVDWVRDRDRLIVVATGASVVILALGSALFLLLRQRERTDEERSKARAMLESAVESMTDGFIMFDASDRLMLCNQRLKDLYAASAPFIVPGATFDEILREGAKRGQYPQAGEDLEAFVQEMVAWHRGNHPPMERLLPDGRWLLITERPMPGGGTVGIRTDITAQKQAMRELAVSERRYSALARAGAIITWRAASDGTVLEAAGWTDLTGLPEDALQDECWLAAIHPDDQASLTPTWTAAACGTPNGTEFRIFTKGAWRWVQIRGVPVFGPEESEPAEWIGTIHDVHDRRTAQTALAESEARFVRAISAVGMGTWDWDLATDAMHLSPGYEALYGREAGSLPTASAAADAIHPDDSAEVATAIERALSGANGSGYDIEFRVLLSDGETRWLRMQGRAEHDAEGSAVRMSGVTQDVTAKRQAEAQLAHMARHDALTDLPNRSLLRERMDEAVERAASGEQFAIFCLDLDRFKQVNDTLGHPVGDGVLKAVAQRLAQCVRKHDTVARIGGDEFAIVQTSIGTSNDAAVLAQRVIAELSQPYEVEGNRIIIGTSVGIAIALRDGGDPDYLLRSADMALYRAKAEGRGTWRFFEPEMNARAQERHALEHDLRRALAQQEFEVFYQPLVDVPTRRVCSFEALVRWRHPDRGMIGPDQFIPVCEEMGLIGQLGEFVLLQACRQAALWPANTRVAVNLSPAQFAGSDVVNLVLRALGKSALPPGRLELEITETLLLQEGEEVLATLQELQAVGVTIAMDDFGTGYSSLSYLRKFPFRKIKIDKSFIHDLERGKDSAAIVQSILGLCQQLNIRTTAEGVETERQLAWLVAAGCSEAQGYLFSPARPAAEIDELLRSSPDAELLYLHEPAPYRPQQTPLLLPT